MPEIAVFIACSLDGYIADADGSLDWLDEAAGTGEEHGFEEFLAGVDAVAMGRATYDFVADIESLPYGDRPLFVFTHRSAAPRAGATFWSVTPSEAVAEWDRRGLRRVYVDGGRLISDFLGLGLVDEITMTVVPRLLGGGHPLFHQGIPRSSWRLTRSREFRSGLVSLSYRRT